MTETNHTTRVRLAVDLPQPVPGQNDYVNASYDQLLEVAAAAYWQRRFPGARRGAPIAVDREME